MTEQLQKCTNGECPFKADCLRYSDTKPTAMYFPTEKTSKYYPGRKACRMFVAKTDVE